MKRGLALSLCVLCASESFARASDEAVVESPMRSAAKAHYDEGVARYGEKDYPAAAESFRKAYEIDPRRDILFAWAQTERLRGNCREAVSLYERYLEQSPPAQEAEISRRHLARCREIVPLPWYKDVWGDLLVGAGVASLGVGIYFFAASSSDADARDRARTDAEFGRLQEDASSKRTYAWVGVGVAASFLTAGIIRYATRGSDRAARDGTTGAIFIDENAVGLVVARRF